MIGNSDPAPENERAPPAKLIHTMPPTIAINPMTNATDHNGLPCGTGTLTGVGNSTSTDRNAGGSAGF
ncbi:hypothetical protein SRL2020226_58140 [Mycobacterium kiyosense]|uniref:Uncharacterized protein n=1 Tax=Mycobacterium kiyosense TaxID=2871094 RepID=A0A9P3QCI4_9MYCO|nr:hypothetical protein SRL2020028_40630 [Mycobacterium kiyosense]GLB99038.1 hypothetical protein SRL2020226_58140 [Mycobacterium kiyosense]GLD33626.1 hypothetical protein Mkiyose1413_55090 [Mycobacterium kiyosense]GLD39236.1 hypothetical protein Mkiyose1595_54560 [Mycobacterium kiyosense]